jgi:kinesin family protein 15
MDEMVATIEALESEFTFKSGELAAVVANCQLLEAVFFHQMNDSIKKLSVDRDALSIQRDQLQGQVILLKESFEKAVAQAEAKKRLHKRLKR